MNREDLMEALFQTEALVVAPADQPFWYTSGLFGPYYINTHYLFGSPKEAQSLLQAIEAASLPDRREHFASDLAPLVQKQYETNETYRLVIDGLVEKARKIPCDLISGGERRDFFFSLEVARQLGKPHLALFKDQGVELDRKVAGDLQGGVALHVADLITEASSYVRAWLPMLADAGFSITHTLAVVDRAQGGLGVLRRHGVTGDSLLAISPQLFAAARLAGRIQEEQEAMLETYYANPHGFVRAYLEKHPDFLTVSERAGGATAERARRLARLIVAGEI